MSDRARLGSLLARIDGASYPAYKQLRGRWDLGDIELIVDHVQGDPFAAPSRVRVRRRTDLPASALSDPDANEAACDWLLRRFGAALGRGERRGSGRSGELSVYRPGPEILQRSALRLEADGTAEVRFLAGLPGRGRRIAGHAAAQLLLDDIPAASTSLSYRPDLDEHVASVQRQRALRRALPEHGLLAFLANGSILPRQSGVSDAPMPDAVPLQAPGSLEVTLDTPFGPVRGLGVRRGITLITGGGFHGKSTLLAAIQTGHLDFVPGDGREQVVTVPTAVKIRAEDGRRVERVDISGFLNELPGGRSTAPMSTDDASGSTSQAAALVEAVESGATVVLLDEDTSATNLLVRDERMRQLIPREREPITPFVERVVQVATEWMVSTVMVVGGVGDYLAVADTVLGMMAYHPTDLTDKAREIAGPVPATPGPLPPVRPRVVLRRGLAPTGKGKIRARDTRWLEYGRTDIDLTAVDQVLDAAQARTIGRALALMHDELVDDRRDVRQVLDALEAILDDEGLEVLSAFDTPDGGLVRPRRHEVLATLSRLRSLQIR